MSWSGGYDGNGERHGAGTETGYDGSTCVGTYVHGKSHGPWVVTRPSTGEVWDIVWDDGRWVSQVRRVSKLQTHT